MHSKIRDNVRIFGAGAFLSYKALFRWLHPVAYIASKVVAPLASMVFFVLLGQLGNKHDSSFFVIGNAMQMASVSGIYGVTMSIGGDRWLGTLVYLFASPAHRLILFFGRSIPHIIDGILGVFIGFVWGITFFGVTISPAAYPFLFLIIGITVFSTSGMGLLMGCVGLITRNVMFVNNTVYMLLLFLSGANIAREEFPRWLYGITEFLPLSHGIQAARSVIQGNMDGVLSLLLWEFLIGVAYLVLGYFLFSSFERYAKKKGSLETM